MKSELRPLTLPLLLLVSLNFLPQIVLRPFWITAFSIVLLSYRLWLEVKQHPMPPRLLLWGCQFVVGAIIWLHYRSFFGEEAGGAFLTMLLALKIFELNRVRDYFFTVMLCLLVLMSYLLLDQGLMVTSFLLLDVFLIISYLMALERKKWSWKFKETLKPSLMMVLKASPLLILTFILFPRFSTGFGSGENTAGRTGVSDSLRPGAVAKLIPSDELVFRATFLTGTLPSQNQLYWRAAVLNVSRGLDWDRSPVAGRPHFENSPVEYTPDIEIYLEPESDRFLFTLDNSQIYYPREGNRIQTRAGRTFELESPVSSRERYYLQRSYDSAPEVEDTAEYLKVEQKPSRELLNFLKPYRGKSEAETIQKLLAFFHEGGFRYTLQPQPTKGLEDFIFRTKTGFCEHFAGSFATLLRYLDIPSRVVVGFQGGTPSILQNYISVRDHDAHAWVEYYDQSSKHWHRVDPTAQVAPLRLTEGSDRYFQNGKEFMPSWMPGDWLRFYFKSRAFLDEVEASWISFLLNFDLAAQKSLLAKLGMEAVLFRALPVFLILAIALTLAFLYFLEAQKREILPPEERLYRQLLKRLAKWRIYKAPTEGPMTLLAKIEAAEPKLVPFVEPLLERLTQARYGQKPLTAKSLEQIRAHLRRLKKLTL